MRHAASNFAVPITSKKELEIALESLLPHPAPSRELEQYTLPAYLAAELLWAAYMSGDVEGRAVLDLGCGTGILAIGAALLGASAVLGVDVDVVALRVAARNAASVGVASKVTWVASRVPEFFARVDTVVENPPFGVWRKGADMVFLTKSMECGDVVYSLHKSSEETRRLVRKLASDMGFSIAWLSEGHALRLKPTMPFHELRDY
ncbi:MAG TPA: methyltransferase domain-containing protein, partial [Armatimonadetes bacterium]|nr:methyltransferase domain-containing protein [Armatimonadota bacterium]